MLAERIAKLKMEKESAIDAQDFEGAAALRDKEQKMITERSEKERHWKSGGMDDISEVDFSTRPYRLKPTYGEPLEASRLQGRWKATEQLEWLGAYERYTNKGAGDIALLLDSERVGLRRFREVDRVATEQHGVDEQAVPEGVEQLGGPHVGVGVAGRPDRRVVVGAADARRAGSTERDRGPRSTCRRSAGEAARAAHCWLRLCGSSSPPVCPSSGRSPASSPAP